MIEIILNNNASNLIKNGFPWVLKKDILSKSSAIELCEPGELASIRDGKGKKIATGYFNPKPNNISARILTLDAKQTIDKEFFKTKIQRALERRKKHFNKNNYLRAVYGESDGLPGLIIDLYGEYAVAQVNSAGMEKLQPLWLAALVELLELKGLYLDASSKHRLSEGLDNNSKILYGELPKVVEVKENGLTYFADVVDGQKTGWFFDQRANRKYLSMISAGRSVLDLYTHSGGFGLLCASNHAKEVIMVDRSDLALSLADQAAQKNKLENCSFINGDVFGFLDNYPPTKKFDIVNADPPAFIKSRKDVEVGLKGYEKLTKKCIEFVKRDGLFAISSCSYFARPEQFQKAVEAALIKSGREFSLLRKSGADKDHPIHPMLSETNYLKFLVYKLD